MIHFDSGKHFRLHKTLEMTSNIRKYLNAYYDFEYASSHPGLGSFTAKNMPGFSAAVPQQDNTKDCGLYMLENAERMLRACPTIDHDFVQTRGHVQENAAPVNGHKQRSRKIDRYLFQYDKHVVENK